MLFSGVNGSCKIPALGKWSTIKSDSCGINTKTESLYLSEWLKEVEAVPRIRTVAPTREAGGTLVENGINARNVAGPDSKSNLTRLFTICDCAAEMTNADNSMRCPSSAPDMNCSIETALASGREAVPSLVQ